MEVRTDLGPCVNYYSGSMVERNREDPESKGDTTEVELRPRTRRRSTSYRCPSIGWSTRWGFSSLTEKGSDVDRVLTTNNQTNPVHGRDLVRVQYKTRPSEDKRRAIGERWKRWDETRNPPAGNLYCFCSRGRKTQIQPNSFTLRVLPLTSRSSHSSLTRKRSMKRGYRGTRPTHTGDFQRRGRFHERSMSW